jgi:hypothetical protein
MTVVVSGREMQGGLSRRRRNVSNVRRTVRAGFGTRAELREEAEMWEEERIGLTFANAQA